MRFVTNCYAYSYYGMRSIERRTLRSRLSKCYSSLAEITILFFSQLANVALLFLLLFLLYRCDEECSETGPIYLKFNSVLCVTITRWSFPPKNRNTLSRGENYTLLMNYKLKLFVVCDQSDALETCFIQSPEEHQESVVNFGYFHCNYTICD